MHSDSNKPVKEFIVFAGHPRIECQLPYTYPPMIMSENAEEMLSALFVPCLRPPPLFLAIEGYLQCYSSFLPSYAYDQVQSMCRVFLEHSARGT